MPLRTDDVIDLLARIRHIELLPGERAGFLVKPGALGKQAATEAEVFAVVMFQTNIIHGFVHIVLRACAAPQRGRLPGATFRAGAEPGNPGKHEWLHASTARRRLSRNRSNQTAKTQHLGCPHT